MGDRLYPRMDARLIWYRIYPGDPPVLPAHAEDVGPPEPGKEDPKAEIPVAPDLPGWPAVTAPCLAGIPRSGADRLAPEATVQPLPETQSPAKQLDEESIVGLLGAFQ